MAYQKAFVFEPTDVIRLCTHYFDGLVPLDAQVTNVGFNPYMQRMIGIECLSKEWPTTEPLHLRYEGKKVFSWTTGQEKHIQGASPDTPKRQ